MELLYPVTTVNLTQGFGENAAWYADESQHQGWHWPGHNGLDFSGALGDPILAAAGGIVTRAAYEEGGYGHFVRLTHPDGWMTYYAHLSRVDVRLNQRLAAGDLLGAMGDSGCADGVHLHFGLRAPSGGPSGYAGYTDPLPYFVSPLSIPEPNPEPVEGVEGIELISIPPQGRARVDVDILNIRSAPGLNATIVGALYAGAEVVYDGIVNQEGCTWLAFAGLYSAAVFNDQVYVSSL